MNNLLEVKNLSKIYHDKDKELLALSNITFDVEKEKFVSIVGPSGCGKSTILSIISGMLDKSSGDIKYNVSDPKIGYMLQDDCLLPWKSVLDNALLGLKIKRQLNEDTKARVINLLCKYGLEDFMDSYPDSLSGGLKQRVALIRTLALDPDILLLDEPFSKLDYQTRLTLSDDIKHIIDNENKTAIMVTHDIAEAISMSDAIIMISKRPGTVQKIIDINLENKSTPTKNRSDKMFSFYYDMIWKGIDNHVQ